MSHSDTCLCKVGAAVCNPTYAELRSMFREAVRREGSARRDMARALSLGHVKVVADKSICINCGHDPNVARVVSSSYTGDTP